MRQFKSVDFHISYLITEEKKIPISAALDIEFHNEFDRTDFLIDNAFFKVNGKGKNYFFRTIKHEFRYLVNVDLPLTPDANEIEPSVKEAAIKWLSTKYPKAYNYEVFKEIVQKPADPKNEDIIINYSDPEKQPQVDEQILLQKEPQTDIPISKLPTPTTAYSLDIKYANDGGRYKFYHTKSLKALKSDFDFTFDVATLSFSNEQFTKVAQNKLGEILLNYAKKSFTFTKLDIAENILDKKTQNKINALLERNRRFSIRKINIVWLAFFIGIMTTGVSMSSLLCILVSGIGVYFYNKHKTSFMDYQEKVLKIELALTIFSVASLSLAFFGPLALGITLFTGIGGLFINHSRDQRIKAAITKYNAPELKLNEVEIDSFKNGKAAKNSYLPLCHWKRSTWVRPQAYDVGYHSPECIQKNKIKPC